MAAFTELDWSRFDVHAIAGNGGLATIDDCRRERCLNWLRRNGFEVETLDCRHGLAVAITELGRLLNWEGQFGYVLGPERCNLDAVRDGFEFDVSADGGTVFELLRADVAWDDDPDWMAGLLSISVESSRWNLALGKRFFTLITLPDHSPLIGKVFGSLKIPVAYWSPNREAREFER